MKNHYLFDEAPVKIWLNPTTDNTEHALKKFIYKYPELSNRLEVLRDELFFLISEKNYISEHDWAVDFLESNINGARYSNGEGNELSAEFYKDLFELFQENGKIYFDSGNAFCAIETVGEFDCRYHFRLSEEGLSWEEDD